METPYCMFRKPSFEDKSSGKLQAHFERGMQDGISWAKTAGLETLQFAAERSTVNEAIKRDASLHPYDLHGYSPLMEGDYPEIEDHFTEALERESDFGFDRKKEYDELSVEVQIPNAAFRIYEDGFTVSVRKYWLKLLLDGKVPFINR